MEQAVAGGDEGPVIAKCLAHTLPRKFQRVLQALICGTGVTARHVYGSRSNRRYTMRLDGPWLAPVRACYEDALFEPTSNVHHGFSSEDRSDEAAPRAEDLFGPAQAWPSVLLKMQRAQDAEPDEDACHAAVTRACPDIAPRFLFSVTVGSIRLTFMEWLEGCATVYTLRRRKSGAMTPDIARVAHTNVVDMWLRAGVLHCDLHANNALVQERTGAFYIVDFGMAVVMPEEMRATLQSLIEEDGMKPASAYDRVCKAFAHKTLLKRGYEVDADEHGNAEWNDDAEFLRLMRSCCRHTAKVHVDPNPEL